MKGADLMVICFHPRTGSRGNRNAKRRKPNDAAIARTSTNAAYQYTTGIGNAAGSVVAPHAVVPAPKKKNA
jgi:hypothetical protein